MPSLLLFISGFVWNHTQNAASMCTTHWTGQSGTTKPSTCSPVWASVWDLAMSGGSLTCVKATEEVSSPYPLLKYEINAHKSVTIEETAKNFGIRLLSKSMYIVSPNLYKCIFSVFILLYCIYIWWAINLFHCAVLCGTRINNLPCTLVLSRKYYFTAHWFMTTEVMYCVCS